MSDLAERVLQACRSRGWTLACAESCTGGLIAATLTDIAGSSDVIGFGFVTYSNIAKTRLLGVPVAMLERHGAVSVETAGAMALGARRVSGADLAVSVTGIAGPGGAVPGKPVGTVCFGLAGPGDEVAVYRERFAGDRQAVRLASVDFALHRLLAACGSPDR